MGRWVALTAARALVWMVAAVAMLVRRTAPLGLALVAPAVFVILLFHLPLTGHAWGTFFAAYTAALMWRHRAATTSMWSGGRPPQRADALDVQVV